MANSYNGKTTQGFSVKLWRGERMALIGMDVDHPEPDLVGFSIEVKRPGGKDFLPLRNRLGFSYPKNMPPSGDKQFPSTEAPFQKFRWVHFPQDVQKGTYQYRVTKQHMKVDNHVLAGTSITLGIDLDPVIYSGFLDVGFARNYASSQAYADRYKNNPKVIPALNVDGLAFKKLKGDIYEWLGFEAYELIMDFLKSVVKDKSLDLDFFAYDLNEPDIVALLEKIGPRLRAIIDDSKDHKAPNKSESKAARRLAKSAGKDHVKRMHFSRLQHNKVMIARRKKDGKAVKVLFGSTNFSFRGIYIQANNVLVVYSPGGAQLFEDYFEQAFSDPKKFSDKPITKKWFPVRVKGKPPMDFCLSPHKDTNLSLNPIGKAIEQAKSSVLFSIAFLNQAKNGAVRKAVDRLEKRPLFSYGISDKRGGLAVNKPDGSLGIVDFQCLIKNTPEPFSQEWRDSSGGGGKTGNKKQKFGGVHEHHKFVVTDFNLPTAKVFTGSCNMSISGEGKNGDNLVMIQDQRVATSYAIEALRIFDHLHFRTAMKKLQGKKNPPPMTLQKPTAIGGKPAWFEKFYVKGSQAANDRKLFSH